ncbi:aldehyde dehydrogenase family 2 member C4-like [Gossypium australe]|uniref:Aldehyde dehydrogenase family 2 member C4-like n=1 Tax=Gossypium australe TaxID=47621 RepID=A0A5B6WQG8_9ROSI|nr:aldehyde dehydrogenase family 2 member C4-like [Gossypium australe]
MDSSHMKTCQNIVRAFDGTKRKVMRRIEIPLLIGLNTYEALDSFGWAVPLSLHQKLKLVTEGQLVTINAEEDIIASVTSEAPYIGADEEAR